MLVEVGFAGGRRGWKQPGQLWDPVGGLARSSPRWQLCVATSCSGMASISPGSPLGYLGEEKREV